jgi:hypothetical protein
MDPAVIDPTIAALRAVAGPYLYRFNAFRITGVPTIASERTVREREQKMVAALRDGAEIDYDHRLPLDPDLIRGAFDCLLDSPPGRLVDEMFWLWDTPNAACGCPRTFHRDHDAAVAVHSAALDREVLDDDPSDDELDRLERMWSDASRLWRRVLDTPYFWEHIRHRIAVLNDSLFDRDVVDMLREEVPVALAAPLLELAVTATEEQGWLADQARAWPAPPAVIDAWLEVGAAPMYDEVAAAMKKAVWSLGTGQPERTVSAMYEQVMPLLKRLAELVPANRHQRTGNLRDEAASVFNDCVTELIERDGPDADERVREWLSMARQLAAGPHTVEAVAYNAATLDELTNADMVDTVQTFPDEPTRAGRPDLADQSTMDDGYPADGVAPGLAEVAWLLDETGDRGSRKAKRGRKASKTSMPRPIVEPSSPDFADESTVDDDRSSEDYLPVSYRLDDYRREDRVPAGDELAGNAAEPTEVNWLFADSGDRGPGIAEGGRAASGGSLPRPVVSPNPAGFGSESTVDESGSSRDYLPAGYTRDGYPPENSTPVDYSRDDYPPEDYTPDDYGPNGVPLDGYGADGATPDGFGPGVGAPEGVAPGMAEINWLLDETGDRGSRKAKGGKGASAASLPRPEFEPNPLPTTGVDDQSDPSSDDGYTTDDVPPGMAEVNWMLDEANDFSSGSRRRRGSGTLLKRAAALLLIAGVLASGVLVFLNTVGGPSQAALFSELVEDNAPVGTCITTEEGWNGNKSAVPVVECDQPHWGEVLGYGGLGAVPSPYPGDEQTEALARFQCGYHLAQQGLTSGEYATSYSLPNRSAWNDGGDKKYENYGTCVLHRADDQPLPTRQLVDRNRKPEDVSVRMDLLGLTPATSAPVGTCVQTEDSVRASNRDLAVVRCGRPHWAEIVGYPVLYEPGTPWPGDNAVGAAATTACQGIAAKRALPPDYRITAVWPGQDRWNDPANRIYAACTAHRADDQLFTGGLP